MKKILFLMMALLSFVGCEENDTGSDTDSPVVLEFKTNKITIDPGSQYQTAYINSTGKFNIKIEGVQENDKWLSYTLSDKELTIVATPNNKEIVKSAFLIIYDEENNISDTLEIVQSINEERIALIKFYKALNGDEWTNNENWCSDKPLSEWYGVTARGDMAVTRLWLSSDAYIEGKLPSCITSLKELREFCFEGTRVGGNFPSNIGNLTKLEHIAIKNCNFSGTIPESLKNCKELRNVDLSHNNFSGAIPEFFFEFPKLYSLFLSHNKFESFSIDINPIEGKLAYISVNNNKISSPIPANLFKIKPLEFIYANDNQIIGAIPENIGDSRNLKILRLENNSITGKLPESMVNLQLLNDFSITKNYLDVEDTDYLSSNPNYSNWRFKGQKQ